jgi:VWFA-related protein
MKPGLGPALATAACACLVASANVRAQAPTFASRVEAVTVDVVILDKKGQPVSGLTRDDFVVSEDGVPQTLTSFDAVVVPEVPKAAEVRRPVVSTNVVPATRRGRTFVLFFDDVHLTPTQAYRAKLAAATFLKTGVRPGDKVTLVASSGAAWWSATVPEGQEELLSILKRLDGRYIPDSSPDRVTDYEAMRIVIYGDVVMARLVARRFDSLGAMARERQSSQGTRPGDTYTDNEAMRVDPLVWSRAQETYEQSKGRNIITLEVMSRALRSLTDVAGRKSMVLVSQGFVNDTDLKEMKGVVEASRRANVPIYFLNTNGLSSLTPFAGTDFGRPLETGDYIVTVADVAREADGTDNLALDTGGFTVRNTNDLSAGINRIANESRSFYLLGYSPTKTTRDGKFRKIQVRLTGERKGLEVRARRGYYAPSDDAPGAPKVPVGDPAVERALDSPFDTADVPLRATAYVFDETIMGRARVFVAGEVDVSGFEFDSKDGRLVGALELLVTAQHKETGEYFRYSQEVQMSLLPETREKLRRTWYPVSREFELPSGAYQARILVRDKRSGHLGSVAHSFEVPKLGAFRISSPILSDQVEPATDGSAPKPVLLARRSFPAGILYCQYTVFGAAQEGNPPRPRVTGSYQIVRPDGTVQKAAPMTPIQPTSLGAVMRFMGINLAGVAPGPYEIVLTVKDEATGTSVEDREPFTLGPPAETATAERR